MNIFYKFTWRSLKENKARTVVTFLGIILAVSLITATMTSVSSLYDYFQRIMADTYGSWHVYLDNLTEDQVTEIKQDDQMDESLVMYNIGYAKLEKSYDIYRPYLYVGGYEGNLEGIANLVMKEGRMPQNSSEIMLPQALEDIGGVKYQIGDTLTLGLGARHDGGESHDNHELWRFSSYSGEDSYPQETWEKTGTKTYTVVGKYRSGMFEASWLAGFTGITKADGDIQARGTALFATVKDTGWVIEEGFDQDFRKAHSDWGDSFVIDVNRGYLNIWDNFGFELKAVIVGMVVLLLIIIAFGSVALIYNSFSLSIGERKRQYGLLNSIGATKRQLKKCMLFESVVLSGAGIPIGILVGMGGMSIAFYCLKDGFDRLFSTDTAQPITLQFAASAAAVGIAAVVGFLTVLVAAWIPVRKAVKASVIEAIRQNDEIYIKPRKLRTSKLTGKLFGLEGMLAVKNFRRNKRRYRTTVFSLLVSIVLFVSATSLCDYLGRSVGFVTDRYDSDLDYRLDDWKGLDRIYDMLHSTDGVTRSVRYIDITAALSVKKRDLTSDAKSHLSGIEKGDGAVCRIPCQLFFVADEDYEAYLVENGFKRDAYMDAGNPAAIVYNSSVAYDTESETYTVFDILEKEAVSAELPDSGQKGVQEIRTGAVCTEVPFGTKGYTGNTLLLFYPMSAFALYEKTLQTYDITANIAFGTEAPDECALRMKKILESRGENMSNLYNNFEDQQASIALITLIKVFSNGFVVLILLIALANVFNTIATSILLRRREFAMLRSIGMTQKGFRRMLNYECLMYGVKGILYGMPLAVLITFAIWRTVSGSIRINFYIPWYAVTAAVGSVFAVVFSTMLYAVHRAKKDNVADTLKGDIF